MWSLATAGAASIVLLIVYSLAGEHEPGGRTIGVRAAIWFTALVAVAAVLRAPRARRRLVVPALAALTGLCAAFVLDMWGRDATISATAFVGITGGVVILAYRRGWIGQSATPRRVLAVGGGADVVELLGDLGRETRPGFECAGVVANRVAAETLLEPVGLLGRCADLVEIVRAERPDLIVCSGSKVRSRTVGRLLDAGLTDVRVLDVVQFSELAFKRVPARHVAPSWFAGVLGARLGGGGSSKRAFDAVVAAGALVIAAPLLLTIAVFVRLSGGGPTLSRQVLSGRDGRTFEALRFRTEVSRPPHRIVPSWATPSRPTAIGRVLRATGLDGLPRLWNVVRGEMSIVGPRPERPAAAELLRERVPYWNRRLLLKPGITGWAQVQASSANGVTGPTDALAYDLYYLKHRSLALDISIVVRAVLGIRHGGRRP